MNGGTGTCENGTKYLHQVILVAGRHERPLAHVARHADDLAARHGGRRRGRPGRGLGIEVRIEPDADALADARFLPARPIAPWSRSRRRPARRARRPSVSLRPSTILMPRMSKNSGVAACRNGSCRPAPGGSARPGTAIGGTLKPENGIAAMVVAARTPGTARTRSSAASNRSSARWRRPVPARRRRRRRCPCDAEVLREQVVEAAAEHAGAGEQQHRQRRLQDEQAGLRRRPACRCWRVAVETARGELPRQVGRVRDRPWRSRRAARRRPPRAASSGRRPRPRATSGSSTCLTAPSNHDASSSDTPVAASATTAASTNACRSSRARGAPSAARIANSRRRRDARTSSSVAALARPMTSTRADTPVSHQATRRSALDNVGAAERRQHDARRSSRRLPAPPRRPPSHRARAWPRSPRSARIRFADPSRATGASRRRTAPTVDVRGGMAAEAGPA